MNHPFDLGMSLVELGLIQIEPPEHRACRTRTFMEHIAVASVEMRRRPAGELHAAFSHHGWEYRTTTGPRKAWDAADRPPPGPGWVRNTWVGEQGWWRGPHEERSFWMRPKRRGGKE